MNGVNVIFYFISKHYFYKTLAKYNKQHLRQVVEELDDNRELVMQYKIFRGLVFISSDCYVVCLQKISYEAWSNIKKSVDKSKLFTKENIIKIIDTMDWNNYGVVNL